MYLYKFFFCARHKAGYFSKEGIRTFASTRQRENPVQKDTVVYPIFDLVPFNWSFMQCHPTKQHVLLMRGESLLSEETKIRFFQENKHLNRVGGKVVHFLGELRDPLFLHLGYFKIFSSASFLYTYSPFSFLLLILK